MSYDASFKLKVVSLAEEKNNAVAAHEFCVDEKQVREWRKRKTALTEMPKTKQARRGDVSMFPELEKELNDWVIECRQNGYIVTRTAVRLQALHLAKDEQYHASQFRASAGWCTRFMNHYGLALRQRTKIAQKLPQQLESKVDNFLQYVVKLRREHGYKLSQIGNMDETPVTFDMPGNRTIAPVGDKTILVKTTGHEKTHFTVVLACMADGSRLKPMIIFKRKTLPKGAKFNPGVIVRAHIKGWMDEAGVQEWLKHVWNVRSGALLWKRAMLVWDQFRAHLTDTVKESARQLKTDLCVIPGGLTSALQPLDVCLNKPFKDRLRKTWTEWMLSGNQQTTKGGHLKRPDITLICSWVKDAWESIPSEMIRRSFLKCGISNAMDGSEDDAVYSDETDDDDSTPLTDDDEDDVYDDCALELTREQFAAVFGDDSDASSDDFGGFEPAE